MFSTDVVDRSVRKTHLRSLRRLNVAAVVLIIRAGFFLIVFVFLDRVCFTLHCYFSRTATSRRTRPGIFFDSQTKKHVRSYNTPALIGQGNAARPKNFLSAVNPFCGNNAKPVSHGGGHRCFKGTDTVHSEDTGINKPIFSHNGGRSHMQRRIRKRGGQYFPEKGR